MHLRRTVLDFKENGYAKIEKWVIFGIKSQHFKFVSLRFHDFLNEVRFQ